ncbi:hypothetical protein PQX77_013124 [Marasmius sp. AFHP31]|nr:hypothetical protein PQX77_013124 [Marasmius sp. AFHP31]
MACQRQPDLVYRSSRLHGYLDESPSKWQQRHQQPIYLFLRPLPPDFNKYYHCISSLHFWSLHEDGQSQLSPESCFDFGLPVQLLFEDTGFNRCFWNTDVYKRIHEYQLARGFDPTTIDFARRIGFDGVVFQPINDSDRLEELREHSDRPDGYNDSKNLVCTSCGQVQCLASHTGLGELTTTMQNTEIETRATQIYHHPEQDVQHKSNPVHYDWVMEDQDSRLVQPFPSFIAPVKSRSLESAHPYEGYHLQVHPAGYNVEQEDFYHPYLSDNLPGDGSLTALNTPATIKSNSSSTINPQAEWLIMPQYPPPRDHSNEPLRLSSSSANPANVDNNPTGNTMTSTSTEPIVSSSNSGTKTTAGQGVDTTRRTGWPGISQIAPFTSVAAFHSTLMADALDESLISSSFEDGYANLGNGFGASMMNSSYTEPAHVSSVDTATGVARYVVPTPQGAESGSSHIAPAPSGSTGTTDAVDGYPLSDTMQVDTKPPNSMVQAHPCLLCDSGYGCTSFSPYHAGGPPEHSQEQSREHTYDPITAPNEQTFHLGTGGMGIATGVARGG